MHRSLGATGMAASAAVLLAACAEDFAEGPHARPGVFVTMRAAQLGTVGEPGPADMPFGEALVTYSRLLADVHAYQGEQSDEAIRGAIFQLATVIERMPAAGAEPGLRGAATAMRRELDGGTKAGEKRALALAATELLRLATAAYRRTPGVAARARTFAGAVEAIDLEREPPDRAAFVDALVRAERALAAMYAVNVAPAPR